MLLTVCSTVSTDIISRCISQFKKSLPVTFRHVKLLIPSLTPSDPYHFQLPSESRVSSGHSAKSQQWQATPLEGLRSVILVNFGLIFSNILFFVLYRIRSQFNAFVRYFFSSFYSLSSLLSFVSILHNTSALISCHK